VAVSSCFDGHNVSARRKMTSSVNGPACIIPCTFPPKFGCGAAQRLFRVIAINADCRQKINSPNGARCLMQQKAIRALFRQRNYRHSGAPLQYSSCGRIGHWLVVSGDIELCRADQDS